MKRAIDPALLDEVLSGMGIQEVSQATIRQSGQIARQLERRTGEEFLHLEMGVPGLPAAAVGVEAECQALRDGVAALYPDMAGIEPLKRAASRFIRAFLDLDIPAEGCIPTVGSMQGSCALMMLCSQLDPRRDTILFIDPGFPVQRQQTRMLGIKSVSFDIYDYRAGALRDKVESYLRRGDVAAIIYSNPNNPAWICLTEEELRTLGELATQYDTVVIEDLAYLCMDFRKPLGRPFEAPYQASVGRYTDNYVLMLSGSKIFSYAGERIAVAAIPEKLYRRRYAELQRRYGIARFGDSLPLTFLYALSSGTSHAAQYALAAMMEAAADGELDFVTDVSEYARRAARSKEIFLRHGFRIVYDRDLEEAVSDGFFYTVGYGDLDCSELLRRLLLCGICAISLSSAGSCQQGVRICISQMNRPDQFDRLDERLKLFTEIS